MNTNPILIETVFNASIQSVWNALTNKDEMKNWYFNLPEFRAEVGFEFQFYGGKDENNQYLHLCKIIEVSKPNKLAYSWRYDGYPGNSLVSFELEKLNTTTKVKLTHSGIESFENETTDFAKSEFDAGWNYIMNVALHKYLED